MGRQLAAECDAIENCKLKISNCKLSEERAEEEPDASTPARSARKSTEFAAECDAIAKCELRIDRRKSSKYRRASPVRLESLTSEADAGQRSC